MESELFIRTDANNSIGLGHLIRCISLAHMLKYDFKITFYCKYIPKALEKDLLDNSFALIKIQEENQFFQQLSSQIIVVLDGYYFNTEYHRKIKEKGCKLVCIDDLNNNEFAVDLVINHAPGIKQDDYKGQSYTKFALGLDYALLRPAFQEQTKRQRRIEKIETILICFGGSDPLNLTERILRVIIELHQFIKIIVVTGVSFIETSNFKRLIMSDRRIDYRHALGEKQMLATILEAELAIVPASGILYEVLACRTIPITGFYVDNQKLVYEGFKEKGLIIDAKDFSNIIDPIKKLNKKGTVTGFNEKSIDLYSKERIRSLFKSICR